MFSITVTDQWLHGITEPASDAAVVVVVDPGLSDAHSLSILTVRNGPRLVIGSPGRAAQLGLEHGVHVALAEVEARIDAAGITLNDPDHIFYLPVAEHDVLKVEQHPSSRQLTEADRELFDQFIAKAPEDDVEEAYVELDHWLVYGTFVNDTLVSAASMYPWDGSTLADLGVITLPECRGRGFGRATVRAMSAHALGLGFEPQYRCQLDNAPSVALADAAGFELFGDWRVVLPEG